MLKSLLILILLSFCIGTGVWLFFLVAVKRGDFDDIEGAKYRMLDDDDLPSDTGAEQSPVEPKDQ